MKHRIIIIILSVLILVPVVRAQEVVDRFYLLEVITCDWRGSTLRAPEYLKSGCTPDGMVISDGTCMDYGRMDVMICGLEATTQQHAELGGYLDTYQFPTDLDQPIPPNEISTIDTTLEAAHIPADWVTPADSYRVMARTIAGMFLYAQRYYGVSGNILPVEGNGLNVKLDTLDVTTLAALEEAATSLGYNWSGVKLNQTFRQMLKYMADEWNSPVHFGNIEL